MPSRCYKLNADASGDGIKVCEIGKINRVGHIIRISPATLAPAEKFTELVQSKAGLECLARHNGKPHGRITMLISR